MTPSAARGGVDPLHLEQDFVPRVVMKRSSGAAVLAVECLAWSICSSRKFLWTCVFIRAYNLTVVELAGANSSWQSPLGKLRIRSSLRLP